ncbi:MAG: hypothetical protein K2H53_05160 [Clostridia bacterium]|nr:hypothetical protein [Clostridia bacterium]
MRIMHLHCTDVGCKQCEKVTWMKKKRTGLFKGKKMYSCKHRPNAHESVDALDCEHFKCKNRGEYSICDTCSG